MSLLCCPSIAASLSSPPPPLPFLPPASSHWHSFSSHLQYPPSLLSTDTRAPRRPIHTYSKQQYNNVYGILYNEDAAEAENENDENEDEDEEEDVANSDVAVTKSSQAQYEEQLRREVESLLTPEEKAILDQNEGPDLSKISTPKWHPLHSLALSVQISSMDKLLESGVHIDSIDKDGFTPLHKAVIGKKEAVISHLLRRSANPHVRDRHGATPLHYAVHVGAMQTVKLLIKYKVDVNVADDDGWTPLHLALQSRNRDITKVLLVNGADKTRRTKDGKTPLDLSLCFGRDFESYDLAKLVKLVPEDRPLRFSH